MEDHDEEIDLTPGTTKSAIVCLLYRNRGLGYRPVEIQEELDLPRGTTATTLARLVDDGYVGKTADSIYYALRERDDLARYAAAREQTAQLLAQHDREPDETAESVPDVDLDAIEAEVEALDDAAESVFDL
jgi:DNA-binding IclR family transcriptional regulator